MRRIKQIPEDFIVNEINNLVIGNKGQYAYFLLKKKNYNTLDAIKKIAKKLKINEKNIGFAGNKDRNAVTAQIISIKNINDKLIGKIQDLKIKDITIVNVGNGSKEISLGSHHGNEFFITIRNLDKEELEKIKNFENKKIIMPNYFGQQRFSKNNDLIGNSLVKKDFKKAIGLILESNSDFNRDIKRHLEEKKNDFIGALRKVPLKLLKLYIHAYQSFIFNQTMKKHLGKNMNNVLKLNNAKIPIIGFGTEIDNESVKDIIDEIIGKEKISFRDFIINQIPELSQEGHERDLFANINDFKIIENGKDELNKNKFKIKINFSLPKGSYATVFIDHLFMDWPIL